PAVAFAGREMEGKGGALAGRGVGADVAAVPLDDFLADREPDPGARRLAGEPAEDLEDAVRIVRVEADAVVAHPDLPRCAVPLRAELDARGRVARGLDRVDEQVLEKLHHLDAVGPDLGQRAALDPSAALLY